MPNYRLIEGGDLADPSLSAAWRQIQERNPCLQSPYFSPEFTRAVAAVRGDVYAVIQEQNNKPVGFFPFQPLAFGWGRPVAGPLSDFHGFIGASDLKWNIDSLLKAAKLSGWSFDHLVESGDAIQSSSWSTAVSPQIRLASSYEHYVTELRGRGSDYIPKTEGLARKLAREYGTITFTLEDNAPDALGYLVRWKRHQYLLSGITDIFSAPWVLRLLQDLSSIKGEHFSGLLSTLRIDGKIIAAHLGMRSRTTFHYWFPTYSPEFSKYSVGIILLLRLTQALANLGVTTIDLGAGMSQYKQRLMNGSIDLLEGAIHRPSLRTQLWQCRRAAEFHVRRNGPASPLLKWPLKAIRRFEWTNRIR